MHTIHPNEKVKELKDNLQAARAEVVASRKCENINDFWDTYVVDYVAMAFSKLFMALRIIPNVVTILSMLAGVSGGVVLALNRGLGMDLLGCLLVFLSAVFDSSDGQVARLTRHFSPIGRLLDGFSDATGYLSIYTGCVIRLWNTKPFAGSLPAHIGLVLFALVVYLLYITQNQLADYYKNLHMYMIDSEHGELSRAKDIWAQMKAARPWSFERFTKLCYWTYTHAQEHRAPKTQALLDAIEQKGKNDALCDAFYAASRKLVLKTNFMTFHLRTTVLLICCLLHLELVGMGFVVLVLEPIRRILLAKYEKLSEALMKLV